MQFFKKIIDLLNKPFPLEESWKGYLKTIIFVSVFITLFLFIFKPFDIDSIERGEFFICLGFGAMTFIASCLYEFGIIQLLGIKKVPEQFTFWKWIIYVAGLMLVISFANFLFIRSWFGSMKWEFLPDMIHGTFMVGIFPTVILGAIALMRSERKYQNIAGEINQQEAKVFSKKNTLPPSIFNIPVQQIRYVVALQNYIKIGHLNSEGQLVEQTERATLKGILESPQQTALVKCHRSYLVNQESIVSISGNAQGLLLSLSDCDKLIPVSRSFVSVFREN